MEKVVIWGDGGGSTFGASADAVGQGLVNFEIVGVISADPNAGILDVAQSANAAYGMDIHPYIADAERGRRQSEEGQAGVLQFLEERDTDNLILMGSMVIMGSTLIRELNGDVPDQDVPKDEESARRLMVPSDDGFSTYLPPEFKVSEQNTAIFGLLNTHPGPTLVTPNSHSGKPSLLMVQYRSRESAQTLHAVSPGIDAGPIVAINRFNIPVLRPEATEDQISLLGGHVFATTQRVEKLNIAHDVENHLAGRAGNRG